MLARVWDDSVFVEQGNVGIEYTYSRIYVPFNVVQSAVLVQENTQSSVESTHIHSRIVLSKVQGKR